jgi:hypothetical protein
MGFSGLANRHQSLMNTRRSALSCSLLMSARPYDSPAYTFSMAFLTSLAERRTEVSTAALALPQGEVHALQVEATKGEEHHLVLYFYLWSDAARDPAAGTVLFKLTVPIYGAVKDAGQALTLAQDFAQQVFSAGAP